MRQYKLATTLVLFVAFAYAQDDDVEEDEEDEGEEGTLDISDLFDDYITNEVLSDPDNLIT